MPTRADVEREARRILAEGYAGRPDADGAVHWAALALEAGLGGPNVAMLAATERSGTWRMVEPDFGEALAEVGMPWPSREEALWAHIVDMAAGLAEAGAEVEAALAQLLGFASELGTPDAFMALYNLHCEAEYQYGDRAPEHDQWKAEVRVAARQFLQAAAQT